jgi:hypothetical protein
MYVALEKENDQKDDQDQQQYATTDVHLQPPWSQVIRPDTHSVEETNPLTRDYPAAVPIPRRQSRSNRRFAEPLPSAFRTRRDIPETTEEA